MGLVSFVLSVNNAVAQSEVVVKNIVSITDATDIVQEPAAFNTLGLPSTRLATLNNGGQQLVSINWNQGDYNEEVGIYNFVGTPVETVEIKNPDGVTSNAHAELFDIEAQDLFDRGSFTEDERQIIGECVNKLLTDNQWTHIYTLKVCGVSSEANALLDWKNATYNSTKVGSPTFNQYSGHKGTGNNANRINSGFNPNGVVTLDNIIMMAWELSDATDGSQLVGCQDGANEGLLILPKSTTSCITRCNSDANDTVSQTGAPVGPWTIERNASGTYTVRIHKTTKTTHSKSSSTVPNLDLWFLTGNNNGSPGTGGTRELGAFLVAHGDADYSLILDAVNDCLVRLHGLGV